MTTPRRRNVKWVTMLSAVVLLAACGGAAGSTAGSGSGGDGGGAGDGDLRIVTTVAPITSITAAIVGDRASISGVVPEGTNSHTFEPSPSVAELVAEADLVVMNGLQLEEPTLALAEANMSDGARLVLLGDEVIDPAEYRYDFSFPESGGKPNPHLWTDPSLALAYAERVRDVMIEVDPAGSPTYEANHDAFAGRTEALDVAMREAFETIPVEHRQLLTYHDAYAYFADNYGFTVIGAIQPDDFGDPTPREVAELIDQVRQTEVPAIFGSEVFPSPVLEQIGNETGVSYVDNLRDDDLPGEPGEPEHSWFGLMRSNYLIMTRALGGDPSALEAFEVTTTVPDQATYPQ